MTAHLKADRIRIFEELHRIIKNGGKLIIDEPHREMIMRSPDHYGHGFTCNALKNLQHKSLYRTPKKFKLVKVDYELTVIGKMTPLPKRLKVFAGKFLSNIINNIIGELEVVK